MPVGSKKWRRNKREMQETPTEAPTTASFCSLTQRGSLWPVSVHFGRILWFVPLSKVAQVRGLPYFPCPIDEASAVELPCAMGQQCDLKILTCQFYFFCCCRCMQLGPHQLQPSQQQPHLQQQPRQQHAAPKPAAARTAASGPVARPGPTTQPRAALQVT